MSFGARVWRSRLPLRVTLRDPGCICGALVRDTRPRHRCAPGPSVVLRGSVVGICRIAVLVGRLLGTPCVPACGAPRILRCVPPRSLCPLHHARLVRAVWTVGPVTVGAFTCVIVPHISRRASLWAVSQRASCFCTSGQSIAVLPLSSWRSARTLVDGGWMIMRRVVALCSRASLIHHLRCRGSRLQASCTTLVPAARAAWALRRTFGTMTAAGALLVRMAS
jgi:hypothetical protein